MNILTIKILLAHGANPWLVGFKKSCKDTDDVILELLNKAKQRFVIKKIKNLIALKKLKK